MLQNAPAHRGTEDLSSDRVLEQLERILASAVFHDSPVQRRLFRFLVEETLAGHEETLKEYTVGIRVFGRGEDYDPKSESIVRVQASVLRKKLAAYYQEAGLQDQIIIDLPKGRYVPEFKQQLPTPARPTRRVLWLLGAGAAVLSVFLLVFLLVPRHQPDWNNHPIWAGFFEPNASTKLILGAAMFYYVPGSGLIVRDNHVQMPDSPDTLARLTKLEALFGTKLKPAEIYTGLGDAMAAYSIGGFFNHASRNLPIELSRHSRWDDLVTSNLIIVASLRFRTLRQELQFPSEFTIAPEVAKIILLHPRTGEQKEYGSSFQNGESGTDYALISVWPGTVPDRHVMTIGGLFTWGTAGAAHFITNPADLRDLEKKLKTDSASDNKNKGLQILIRVHVKEGQPIGEEYVTHRWLSSGN